MEYSLSSHLPRLDVVAEKGTCYVMYEFSKNVWAYSYTPKFSKNLDHDGDDLSADDDLVALGVSTTKTVKLTAGSFSDLKEKVAKLKEKLEEIPSIDFSMKARKALMQKTCELNGKVLFDFDGRDISGEAVFSQNHFEKGKKFYMTKVFRDPELANAFLSCFPKYIVIGEDLKGIHIGLLEDRSPEEMVHKIAI